METRGLVALVTGGNRGLGFGIVREFARRGMQVYLGSRDVERGREAAGEIAAEGAFVSVVELDVTNLKTVQCTAARIDQDFHRLDILVNNAGIHIGVPALELSVSQMRKVYETNVFGIVTMTHEFLPLLKRSRTPRIVNVASATASHAWASDPELKYSKEDHSLAYASSKSAVTMLTIQYANAFRRHPEYAHMKINAASPGYVATDLNNHQGTRTIAEGARIVVNLATVDYGGPSGGFFSDDGPVAW